MSSATVLSVLDCLRWSEEEAAQLLHQAEVPTEIAAAAFRIPDGRLAAEEVSNLLDELADFGDCIRLRPDPKDPAVGRLHTVDFLLIASIPHDTKKAFGDLFERPFIESAVCGFSNDRAAIRAILIGQGQASRSREDPNPEELLTQARSFILEKEFRSKERDVDNTTSEPTEEQKRSVTAPKGFRCSGVYGGLKKSRRDVALLVSDAPCICVGRFTQNRFLSPAVRVSKEHLAKGDVRAVAVNSGNANAATGARGLEDARRMTEIAADALNLRPDQVLVCSTGLIGAFLPMEKIESGIREAAASLAVGEDHRMIEAIMTTDVRMKSAVRIFTLGEAEIRIGGIAKGSGMIHPNMATMHAYLTTDAKISREALDAALGGAVERSFNALSVDGDTSTSDCVLLFANGAAGGEEITLDHPGYPNFESHLRQLCIDLTRQMARDGEGAEHLVRIVCQGAASHADALEVGRTLATSLLVKTAIFGKDANWGRIVAAVGRTQARFDPDRVRVWMVGELLFDQGMATDYDEAKVERGMGEEEVEIRVDLGAGDEEAVVYTCDLSYDYVRINAEYRT